MSDESYPNLIVLALRRSTPDGNFMWGVPEYGTWTTEFGPECLAKTSKAKEMLAMMRGDDVCSEFVSYHILPRHV